MGFRKNDQQQMAINDSLNSLTERQQQFMGRSWAKTFGDHIFPLIDEERFMPLYCHDNGRPNTPVNVVVGSLILSEMFGLNDEELVESVVIDPRFHCALRLSSFTGIPYSDRTPSRFRERLYRHELETGEDLLKCEIERISGEFAEHMEIKGTLKRMDSFMIGSSCKRMGRLELMYTCVSNMVKATIKGNEGHLLPGHLHKYADDSNKNGYCYRMEKGEAQSRLEALTADALQVYEICANAQSGSDEFQLLERMLFDQTKDDKLKENKEIKATSLQNPSDEDATFRRKNGVGHQGYVGNVVEDCGENGNIITQYDVANNLHCDTAFALEVIEALGPQEKKTVITVDGSYPSDEVIKLAREYNIEIVPSALSGAEPNQILNEFKIEDNEIKACPAGHAPISSEFNKERTIAIFDREPCAKCPHSEKCPVKIYKTKAKVILTKTSIDRAKLAARMKTEEYKEYARKRNGIEGIPSVMRRRYGVDNMPVRGLLRLKMRFGFKIGAINAKRMIKFIQKPKTISIFIHKNIISKLITIFLDRISLKFASLTGF